MRKNSVVVKRTRTRTRTKPKLRKNTKRHGKESSVFGLVLNPVENIFPFAIFIVIVIIIVLFTLSSNCDNSGFVNNKSSNNANTHSQSNTQSNTQTNEQSNTNNNPVIVHNSNDQNDNNKPIKIVVETSCEQKQPQNLSYFQYQNLKANERIINPLLPPERSMESSYGIPINVPTRGVTGSFQQIGALYKETINSEDMTPGNNTDSVVLALFGKQTYPRSQKWTYYTSSDANHQIKMPLSNKGRKCDSQYGCEEISNDDLITVPGYNGVFKAVIYDYDAPKYIPCV